MHHFHNTPGLLFNLEAVECVYPQSGIERLLISKQGRSPLRELHCITSAVLSSYPWFWEGCCCPITNTSHGVLCLARAKQRLTFSYSVGTCLTCCTHGSSTNKYVCFDTQLAPVGVIATDETNQAHPSIWQYLFRPSKWSRSGVVSSVIRRCSVGLQLTGSPLWSV